MRDTYSPRSVTVTHPQTNRVRSVSGWFAVGRIDGLSVVGFDVAQFGETMCDNAT